MPLQRAGIVYRAWRGESAANVRAEVEGANTWTVIASRFNEFVVSGLVKGAVGAWEKYGGNAADLPHAGKFSRPFWLSHSFHTAN